MGLEKSFLKMRIEPPTPHPHQILGAFLGLEPTLHYREGIVG